MLRQKLNPTINKFEGEYAFLSNFFPSEFIWEGLTFMTVEHFYQAMKSDDGDIITQIADSITPNIAKQRGKKVQLRPDWEEIKQSIMFAGLWMKFSQNPHLKFKLLATTNNILIEGNWWHDCYWGSCYCNKCQPRVKLNMLGQLLMRIRDIFKPMGIFI